MRMDAPMHTQLSRACLLAAALSVTIGTGQAAAQAAAQTNTIPRWARVSFFAQVASTKLVDGGSSSFSEIITNVSAESAHGDRSGLEYGLNVRYAGFPSSEERDARVSIYDAYVGKRLRDGTVLLRLGQMWLNDLGSLGSVGGIQLEFRQATTGKGTRFRAGVFAGLEPKILQLGYESSIKKFGGYVALEAADMRRHVVGYTNVRNENLIERSVLSFTNYIPVRKRLYVYQIAEVDLSGPGGQGTGGLSYLFANARLSVSNAIELQGLFHKGRSLDARSITDDMRNGRPVSSKTLEGMQYQSIGGRVTVRLLKNLRVFGGYSQDKNNRDDVNTDRLTFGAFSSNVFGTGLDVSVTDNRMRRGTQSSWDSWYVSLGRNFGSRLYVTGDYSTSLSVFRMTRYDGVVIDTKPNTRRFSLSGMINLRRRFSVQFTGEQTKDDTYTEFRFLSGLVVRF
jgi:hypothetical protein